MSTIFDFRKQLHVGNDGEKLFQEYYSSLIPKKSEERHADFILKDGSKVELKTDTYPMKETKNFFMEMFGNINDSKLGGPWRAVHDEVEHFVYFYVRDNTFFWFDSIELAAYLDNLISTGSVKHKDVRNHKYTTRGYLVPRDELHSIIKKKDTF